MSICTSCQKGTLAPIIKSREFMIIKESITQNDLDHDQVFTLTGKSKYGKEEHSTSYYLMQELGKVGLQMTSFSLTSLFLHFPPKRRRSKEEKETIQGCVDFSVVEAIKSMQNMKVILMMGAEVVKTFTGYGVSDVSGLVCTSALLPSVPVIVPAPNPDKIMSPNQPIGELRFALKTFAREIEAYKQYQGV